MNKALCTRIGQQLIKNKRSLAVAESVTAGSIQLALSLAKNTTAFFQGGITTYNLGQKTRLLGVDPIEAELCNCVSVKVSETMALNTRSLFLADYGLAITGYAALIPEKNINSLYAFVSIARNGKIIVTQKIRSATLKMEVVQAYYTHEALKLLEEHV